MAAGEPTYLWTYLREASRLVLYDFTTTRSRAGPTDFLWGFSGTLLTAGYAGYDEVVSTAGLIRAGCWSHARRKYYDARLDDRRRCGKMLKLIQQLFAVERQAKDMRAKDARAVSATRTDAPACIDASASATGAEVVGGVEVIVGVKASASDPVRSFGDAEHLTLRGEESVPLIEKIRECANAWSVEVLPRSSVGRAVSYMLNQWQPLSAFLENPSLPLDNNASERAMRHVVIGRKNWMFAGSESGGHRAAKIYSIVATCKLNGLDPFAYLRHTIDRLPHGDDPATLLPTTITKDQLPTV
ncbi:MAG: IS66 family transposase [Planctomycetes bacterium]|nr:IS66 family transposase [Planctomycetota bacterium]